MRNIKDFILEAYKKPIEPFIIKDTEGNDVEFEPSRWEVLNKAFEWITKHTVVDNKSFERERVPFKVDRTVFKTDKYELKSAMFVLDPDDQDWVDRNKIKSGEDFKKLVEKYKGTLKDNQIIGKLVPAAAINRNRNGYGEVILTKKNVLWNYIDDFAFPISNEKII